MSETTKPRSSARLRAIASEAQAQARFRAEVEAAQRGEPASVAAQAIAIAEGR